MKSVLKNIILLAVVLVLSYFTAPYFGGWYDEFSPLYDRSIFALTKQELIFFIGFPFAYIFFTILLLKIFAFGNKNKWIGWVVAPAILFFAVSDIRHIYLPILFGIVSFGLALVINKIFKKN